MYYLWLESVFRAIVSIIFDLLFSCVTAWWGALRKKLARGLVTKNGSASAALSRKEDSRREIFPSHLQLCGWFSRFLWYFSKCIIFGLNPSFVRLCDHRKRTLPGKLYLLQVSWFLLHHGKRCKHYFARFFLQVVVAFCYLVMNVICDFEGCKFFYFLYDAFNLRAAYHTVVQYQRYLLHRLYHKQLEII